MDSQSGKFLQESVVLRDAEPRVEVRKEIVEDDPPLIRSLRIAADAVADLIDTQPSRS